MSFRVSAMTFAVSIFATKEQLIVIFKPLSLRSGSLPREVISSTQQTVQVDSRTPSATKRASVTTLKAALYILPAVVIFAKKVMQSGQFVCA